MAISDCVFVYALAGIGRDDGGSIRNAGIGVDNGVTNSISVGARAIAAEDGSNNWRNALVTVNYSFLGTRAESHLAVG